MGVAHLWKQDAYRLLASVRLAKETPTRPGVFGSVGVQGIATGNPGYSLTAEKNFATKEGQFNIFGGVGFRSNEEHFHGVGGAKFAFPAGWTVGLQLDGHQRNPFLTFGRNGVILGVYLIDGKDPAYMAGVRF